MTRHITLLVVMQLLAVNAFQSLQNHALSSATTWTISSPSNSNKRPVLLSSLQMTSSKDVSNNDSPWYWPVSIPYAAALGVFVGFAAVVAPGEFGSSLDNDMIQAYIDNPASPNLNPIFNTEFNLLGAAPLVLAGLVCPQNVPEKGVQPGPFLAASAAAGYGGLGMVVPLKCMQKRTLEYEYVILTCLFLLACSPILDVSQGPS